MPTTTHTPTTDDLSQLCRQVVTQLLETYQWRLMAADALTGAVLARVAEQDAQARPAGEQLRKLAIHLYCLLALHPACLGSRSVAQQQQAFCELADYLYRIAQRTWPGVAEDATQDALVAIFEKAHLCRNGGAFLAFAIQKVRDAARRRLRLGMRERSLDELLESDLHGDAPDLDGDAGWGALNLGMMGDDAALSILEQEMHNQVVAQLQRLRRENPRARRQFDVVWLRYVQELSLEEIALHLETPVQNVSVLLSRGLERLRQDPQLLALAGEMVQRFESG